MLCRHPIRLYTGSHLTYLLGKHVSSEVAKSKLEATILTVDKDLDSDQCVRSNWTIVRKWCAHDVGSPQEAVSRLQEQR